MTERKVPVAHALLSRRGLLRWLMLGGGVMVGGLAMGTSTLPVRFWRGVTRPTSPDLAARIRMRARPFAPETLDEPHDLAG